MDREQRDNNKQRMDFVEKWANYVVAHSDKEWSKNQAMLIDSQINNARHIKLTKQQVNSFKSKSL